MKKVKTMMVCLLITALGHTQTSENSYLYVNGDTIQVAEMSESISASAANDIGDANSQLQSGLPPLTPLPPNPGSLAMFADYPVSHYTGVPQIDIPLFEIPVGDYVLPLSLSYHSSGIKVSQEASWVGLGWALNAGGAISRIVRGFDDFNEYATPGVLSGFYEGLEITESNEEDFFYSSLPMRTLKIDPEPDIFTYNLPGYAGKFIIDKSRGAVLFNPVDNLKIEIIKESLLTYHFRITTPDGVQYLFNEREKTSVWSLDDYLNKNGTAGNKEDDYTLNYKADPTRHTSSWLLTKITTSQKKEIEFVYEEEFYIAPTQEMCVKYYILDAYGDNGFCHHLPNRIQYSRSKTEHNTFRLSKIKWDGGSVDFECSAREDVYEHNYNSGYKGKFSKKLDKLVIKNMNNETVKSFVFTYDYFNKSKTGDYAYLYKRLKLTGLIDGSSNYFRYRFSYFDSAMPAKNSSNTDLWGYYNGKNQGAEYYAACTFENKTYQGADKTSSLTYARIGTLNEIQYPTGEHSLFTYALNEYTEGSSIRSGGGLRVASIQTSDKTRNFIYNTGRLLIAPRSFYDLLRFCISNHIAFARHLVQLPEAATTLSSLHNGNVIGYDKVEEYITVNNIRHRTIYNFHNTPEKLFHPNYIYSLTETNFYNGLPTSIEYYSDNILVGKNSFTYETASTKQVKAFTFNQLMNKTFYFNYKIDVVRKISEAITNYPENDERPVTTVREYSYNQYHLLAVIREKMNNTLVKEKRINYLPDNKYYRIAVPHEQVTLTSNGVIAATRITYKDTLDMYLPKEVQEINQPAPLETTEYSKYYQAETTFDLYNLYGKPIQVSEQGTTTVYLWSYKSDYPVAQITNCTYAEVESFLTKSFITSLAAKSKPSTADMETLDSLRTKFKYAAITTYEHQPLVDVTSITDPRGFTSYYEYDVYNLLNQHGYKENGEKKIIERYENHYKWGN